MEQAKKPQTEIRASSWWGNTGDRTADDGAEILSHVAASPAGPAVPVAPPVANSPPSSSLASPGAER
ncbi:unnamed protein product [Arabis nemorensis]|uniref:Uncharacterized protein n=1 Tax=Arabis nemorensis TaxID=586526 RepID=A0A565AL16_9BRAS|nr:unnamed protein product [Arabis nemorensis]